MAVTVVKICGLARAEDVAFCAQAGANLLGFVVNYPHPVPWNITPELATTLIAAAPANVPTCIVTGGPVAAIEALALTTGANYVQLHNAETVDTTAAVVRALAPHNIGVIKAIFPTTPEPEATAHALETVGVTALLSDPRTPNNATASGPADLDLYERLQASVSCPVILAGGITPANLATLIARHSPSHIDIMTGVETRPGVKDPAKVTALFEVLAQVTS
ncbi:MAG: phosphoribosylanthranilate isomerase [Propionibacteriaceae bacterium]|jgi:phosphoribosylanthranilate isomerase|nr:phosphoribosylanthranilate isomerase [Propionibacteriaceae bacterium]